MYENSGMGKRSNSFKGDFRSDTVTQPTEGMLQAMASTTVGDDVYGDDPAVNELQERFAALVGKEMSVFFPSGTQSNLAAILTHCGRGSDLLVGNKYHTYVFEAGGASVLGGISFTPLPTEEDGSISNENIASHVKPDDPHFPETRLLCLENTVSGNALTVDVLKENAATARKFGLGVHLDGARLFNAAIELNVNPIEIANIADTVSVCLSKGLGAPVGTLLAGPSRLERSIRRNRKILGGGMRQSGYLAAAGLYALDNHIDRLVEDHNRAKLLTDSLNDLTERAGVKIIQKTNMVFFEPRPDDHQLLHDHLHSDGFLVTGKKPAFRFVTHLGINDRDVEMFTHSIKNFYKGK